MKTRIGSYGHCGVIGVHPGHLYATGVVDNAKNVVMGECPGQYVHCMNCDDTGCMNCVMRVIHDKCTWSCPDCSASDAMYLHDVLDESE